MNQMSRALIRVCPNCGSRRPLSGVACENVVNAEVCGWPLLDEPIVAADAPATDPAVPSGGTTDRTGATARARFICTNGHELDPGDLVCLVCGADAADSDEGADQGQPEGPTVIAGWEVLSRLQTADDDPFERFLVRNAERTAALVLYGNGTEPDAAVQAVLKRTPAEHVPELLATGR